jgi:hypothetical protein
MISWMFIQSLHKIHPQVEWNANEKELIATTEIETFCREMKQNSCLILFAVTSRLFTAGKAIRNELTAVIFFQYVRRFVFMWHRDCVCVYVSPGLCLCLSDIRTVFCLSDTRIIFVFMWHRDRVCVYVTPGLCLCLRDTMIVFMFIWH